MSEPRALPHVLAFALEHPWALTPEMVALVAAIVARRIAGRPDDHAWAQSLERRPLRAPSPTAVAVIPIHGVICPRMNMVSDISGGTSYEEATAFVRAAAADPNVGTIVLDLDTPGGSTAGVNGLARAILAARAQKPVIAQVEHRACSAGYWLAACASEICAAPLALVGSIGVYAMHENLEKALEQEGVQVTYISAGKYKVEGAEIGPLSPGALAHRQAMVDEAYQLFLTDVALGRGVSAATVAGGFGEGRTLSASMALDAKMIDRIATLDDTLARVTTTAPGVPALRAQTDTAQEPARATAQDRSADVAFMRNFEASLVEARLHP